MNTIELILLAVFGLIPFWSLVNSGWDFITGRRRRPFIKAQLEADRLQRCVGVPNPRDRNV